MLETRDLNARYGGIHAVRGVSMAVPAGRVTALVGRNGAGKSSFLRAVAGVLKPSSGEVLLDGVPVTGQAAHRLVRKGLVLVPEERRIFGGLTVRENLLVGLRRPRAERAGALAKVYDVFPALADLSSQLGGTLSGGQQQMLAIARALLAEPQVLLLDEPTLGLAPVIVEDVFRAIATLSEAGQTVLLVEQNAVLAVELAHYVYVLSRGCVVSEGPASEYTGDVLVAAYL